MVLNLKNSLFISKFCRVPEIKGVDWQPTTSSKELTYLELISPEEINLKTDNHFAKTMEFWDSLPLLENKQILNLKDEL